MTRLHYYNANSVFKWTCIIISFDARQTEQGRAGAGGYSNQTSPIVKSALQECVRLRITRTNPDCRNSQQKRIFRIRQYRGRNLHAVRTLLADR